MSDFPIWAAVGIFFGVLAGIPATILIMAQAADNATARRPRPANPLPPPRRVRRNLPAMPDQPPATTWRVLPPAPLALLDEGNQTNVVFDAEHCAGAACYFCQRDEGDHRPHALGDIFLAGPRHSPCNGEANYICRQHLDPNAVIVSTRKAAP